MRNAHNPVRRRRNALLLLLVSAMLAAVPLRAARAVQLDIGNGAGTVGDTVLVAIATTDLTGLGVYSYELVVTWPSSYATAIGAPVAGTLTSPWGAVTANPTPGRIEVAAAGAAPLAGGGTLLNLQFVLGPSAGNVTLTFTDFLFNEGAPADTLSNGLLSITALPVVSISPNSGEILVGDSLQFFGSGGTAPYSFSSSNDAVASFGGNAFLNGVSPGSVTATVTDNNGVSDVTNGLIHVRALKLTVGAGSGAPGDTLLVAVSITNPAPYGITSAEFEVTYNETYLTALDASDAGTIAAAAGWAAPYAGVSSGKVEVALAGTSPLAGPGVLTYLRFVIDPIGFSANVALVPTNAMFNEVYPSINVNGNILITVASTITVTPNTATIVAGDQLQFFISGTVTPPVSWGRTNASVASIDGTGKLTATAAGTTRVYATDTVGRTDTTDTITICDLYLIAPMDTVFLTYPTDVPINLDRSVTGMGIYGYELQLTFDASKLFVAGVSSVGTVSASWGTPTYNTNIPGKVIVVHAGATPLAGTGSLVKIKFQAYYPLYGSSSSLTISKILFNEGDPCALVQNGTLSFPTGIRDGAPPALHLEQNMPNPFNPRTAIFYRVAAEGEATLRVYSSRGELVCTLAEGRHEPGIPHRVEWDGRDRSGRRVASGVYFYRLESRGMEITRKMILLK